MGAGGLGLGNGTGEWRMGMERRQTVRLQRGVSPNVFPNNRDRAI